MFRDTSLLTRLFISKKAYITTYKIIMINIGKNNQVTKSPNSYDLISIDKTILEILLP